MTIRSSHAEWLLQHAPETLFEAPDLSALMSLCEAVLSSGFWRYDTTFAMLFSYSRLITWWSHAPWSRLKNSFPSEHHSERESTSNIGLLSLLRRFEPWIDSTRFRMLLLNVGVYDSVVTVDLISSLWTDRPRARLHFAQSHVKHRIRSLLTLVPRPSPPSKDLPSRHM